MATDKRFYQKNYPVKIFAVLLLLSFSSCIFVPFIESAKQIGVTSSDRANLLDKQVKDFNDACYWGNESLALGLVAPELQPVIRQQFREHQKAERRIVSAKVLSTELKDDSWTADVEVQTKMFEPTTLIVKNSNESQHWIFTLSDGWKLQSRVITPAG